ncbi:MAG TPA: ATPase domain-containing protein [Gemmataceae bacterium]|jgi:circadian clock protein KaiC|nr:ATPase domain-containing protein [Gemmataceae bacterium]
MNSKEQERVKIRRLPAGVPGLDEILGGGLPEYSFNIIAGAPGSGKTTLAHQIVFANAGPKTPALYFTVLGEPAIKMLRYQQQFTFFDHAKLDGAIRFVNLSQLVLDQDLGAVLDAIVKEVEASQARIVVVDSFRTVVRKALTNASEMELQGFVQRLALHLTSWQATTFLIGEYVEGELRDNPVFTVADGLLWLYQSIERNSIVRKLQVMKLRGQASVPGLHTFRITEDGLQTFPRTFALVGESDHIKGRRRLSTGIRELDALLGGGIPEGDSLLLAGPSGAGKSLLGTHFIAEGLRQGEPGIVAIFEEIPAEYAQRAAMFGFDFDTPQKDGTLKLIYLRPLDLSVDETVHEIVSSVKKIGCKRLVIDSLVGFEMALAPGFRTDFRESLYRMIAALTRLGVTIVTTVEVDENFTSMNLSNFTVSFLADDILRLRYVSINGRLRKMLLAVKMRRSEHSIDMVEYTITSKGVAIGEPLRGYRALTSGIPSPWSFESGEIPERYTEAEREKPNG